MLLLLITSCKKSPVEATNIEMLKCLPADVSCTEIRLTLNTGNFPLPATATITLNGNTAQKCAITTRESVLTLNSLLPGKAYKITGSINGNNRQQDFNILNIKTLDTTSHSWTFETISFGYINSYFSDVAIINDTLAYVVGYIYAAGIPGYGSDLPYCLAQWNGKTWTLKHLYYTSLDYTGTHIDTNLISYALGVLAFDAKDIWIAPGSVFHWNGKDSVTDFVLSRLDLPSLSCSVNKLFGFSKNDFYGVGYAGTIVHFTSGKWQIIKSGTDLDFYDIYGVKDALSGAEELYAVCSRNLPLGTGIFSINGNLASPISNYPLTAELYSVWFVPNQHYYVLGDGIYEKTKLSDSTWRNGELDFTKKSTTSIRGNGVNDVMVVGAFGEFLHFNGATWKSYISQTSLPNGSYGSVAMKGNLVIAVGHNNTQGIITIGRR
jgi:hypothetical protein